MNIHKSKMYNDLIIFVCVYVLYIDKQNYKLLLIVKITRALLQIRRNEDEWPF